MPVQVKTGEKEMKYIFAVFALLASGAAFGQAPGSKVYIPPPAPNQTVTDGTKVVTTTAPAFNIILQAELFRERLPLTMVTDSAQADYTMQWAAIPEEGNATYRWGHNIDKELYTVSASLLGKDGQVVWAGSADKKNLRNCAEVITKQLKDSLKGKK
jgi:hypothetical protein